jgi:hypothetical protein
MNARERRLQAMRIGYFARAPLAEEWERRVRAYEEQGCTRSDAQSIVDVEFQREGKPRQ